jgi:hypothetical protein
MLPYPDFERRALQPSFLLERLLPELFNAVSPLELS